MGRLREVRIEGILALDAPADLAGARVSVELRDSGLADGPSVVVGSTSTSICRHAVRAIEFSMDAKVVPDRVYTLGAEVRHGEKLAPGDLLNVASHEWRAGDPNPIVVEVKPIV